MNADVSTTRNDLMEAIRTTSTMVTISVTTWGASVNDRAVADEVTTRHGAVANSGAFRKSLFPGADGFIKDIRSVQNSFRNLAKQMTLPMHSTKAEAPYRLLPNSRAREFIKMLTEHKDALNRALDRAEAAYPEAIKAAQANLGSMYNAEDYRDPSVLRDAFTIDADFAPFPEAKAFENSVALPEHIAEALNQRMSVRMNERVNTMVAEVSHRAIEHAAYIQERMQTLAEAEIAKRKGDENAPKTRLTDQIMKRAAELESFTRDIANMIADPHLHQIADTLNELARFDVADLKGDPFNMHEMAVCAAQITGVPAFDLGDVPPATPKAAAPAAAAPEPSNKDTDLAARLLDEGPRAPSATIGGGVMDDLASALAAGAKDGPGMTELPTSVSIKDDDGKGETVELPAPAEPDDDISLGDLLQELEDLSPQSI